MRSPRRPPPPAKAVEVERLAREALELHYTLPSPITADALNVAMSFYAKTFGTTLALAFQHRELSQLWESNKENHV